jgi:hypothetical protein
VEDRVADRCIDADVSEFANALDAGRIDVVDAV